MHSSLFLSWMIDLPIESRERCFICEYPDCFPVLLILNVNNRVFVQSKFFTIQGQYFTTDECKCMHVMYDMHDPNGSPVEWSYDHSSKCKSQQKSLGGRKSEIQAASNNSSFMNYYQIIRPSELYLKL